MSASDQLFDAMKQDARSAVQAELASEFRALELAKVQSEKEIETARKHVKEHTAASEAMRQQLMDVAKTLQGLSAELLKARNV